MEADTTVSWACYPLHHVYFYPVFFFLFVFDRVGFWFFTCMFSGFDFRPINFDNRHNPPSRAIWSDEGDSRGDVLQTQYAHR